jgi:hypothetical protein
MKLPFLILAWIVLTSSASASNIACLRQVFQESVQRRAFNPPLGVLPEKGAYLMDSNILSAIIKTRDGRAGRDSPRYQAILRLLERKTRMDKRDLLDPRTEHSYFWVTQQIVNEYDHWHAAPLPPRGVFRAKVAVSRTSPEFEALLDILKRGRVGGDEGQSDRIIVAEAFFAATEKNSVPTFVTMDSGISDRLCRFSPDCRAALKFGSPDLMYPDGFVVQIAVPGSMPRKLRVLAVPRER